MWETPIFFARTILSSLLFFALAWLFFDTLFLRIEAGTLLKGIGFFFLGISQITEITRYFSALPLPFVSIGIAALGLYFILVAYLFDAHSKLQFLVVVIIASLFLLKDHVLLAACAFVISITVLHIAHYTKHKDLIPLGVGFVLIAIGEFFYFLDTTSQFNRITVAGDFLYIFAAVNYAVWLWPYLFIRFKKDRSLSRLEPADNS